MDKNDLCKTTHYLLKESGNNKLSQIALCVL